MKYKTVIFDVDGTLFDTSQGIFSCIQFVLDSMNYPQLEVDKLRKFIGPPVYDSFMAICGMSSEEAKKATQLYRSSYVEKFISFSKLYDGMADLINELKNNGVKIGIATMKTGPQIEKLLDIFNLTETFDSVSFAVPSGKKSKSDIINEVLDATATGPEDAVMIGDSIYDGVGASSSAVDFIAVSYGFGINSEQQLKDTDTEYVCFADSVKMLSEYLS
ncbi:MAG: HAD-IA family hydrolase [Clostridia bacterium]|nr:HAD-IA family hydrolase [Clostridia bacterium]